MNDPENLWRVKTMRVLPDGSTVVYTLWHSSKDNAVNYINEAEECGQVIQSFCKYSLVKHEDYE